LSTTWEKKLPLSAAACGAVVAASLARAIIVESIFNSSF
jgi:hypothetical protein